MNRPAGERSFPHVTRANPYAVPRPARAAGGVGPYGKQRTFMRKPGVFSLRGLRNFKFCIIISAIYNSMEKEGAGGSRRRGCSMALERVTSRKTPLIVRLRALASDGAFRRAEGEYLCDGHKLLTEALEKGAELRCVLWKEARGDAALP